MIKVGMIGQGSITGAHYPGYKKLEAEGIAQIQAVCDIRPEMLNKHQKMQNGADIRTYGDYHDLIAAEAGNLDYVDIALPTFLHPDAAITAMEAGLNVIVEKPMALSYEECLRMCECAKRTGKKLMVAQCCRFEAFADAARYYIESGELGRVKNACFKRDGGTPRWAWENWFVKEELSGGALLDLHVHDVDLLNDLFGIPESVSSGAGTFIEGDGPDLVSTNYYYNDGLFTHSTGDWTTDNLQCYGRVYQIKFEKGNMIQANLQGNRVNALFKANGEVIDLEEQFPHRDMYEAELRYFIDCVANDKPVDRCSPESTAESIRIALSEKLSAKKNGERIFL